MASEKAQLKAVALLLWWALSETLVSFRCPAEFRVHPACQGIGTGQCDALLSYTWLNLIEMALSRGSLVTRDGSRAFSRLRESGCLVCPSDHCRATAASPVTHHCPGPSGQALIALRVRLSTFFTTPLQNVEWLCHFNISISWCSLTSGLGRLLI